MDTMVKTNESYITSFLKLESAGGIILMMAAVLAMICANTPLQSYYALLLDTPVAVQVGALQIAKPLLLWINDGLMAVFFFLVGLELKRELLEGELSDKRNIILPGVGAVGGMAVPALIYVVFNWDDPVAVQGWAIPAATDIAFALGVLSLLGSRVPTSIKIFLTSLAIFDDIGAIIIIALFYTEQISTTALIVVACCIPVLAVLNRRNVDSKSAYILIGIIMWIATLKSGVHATLAGFAVAWFIPIAREQSKSMSYQIEHGLHPWIAFFVLPLFAFANAGVSLSGAGIDELFTPISIGIIAGLFVGKQLGIFAACYLAVKLKLCKLPQGATWGQVYGVCLLCGVGFTMSLFIGSLAFEEQGLAYQTQVKVGVLVGSLFSAIAGALMIRHSSAKLAKARSNNVKLNKTVEIGHGSKIVPNE